MFSNFSPAFPLSPGASEFVFYPVGMTYLKSNVCFGIEKSTAQHSTAQHSTAQHSSALHSTAQHLMPADEVILVCQHGGHHVVALQGLAVLHSPEGLLNDAGPLLVLDGGAGGVAPHQLGA